MYFLKLHLFVEERDSVDASSELIRLQRIHLEGSPKYKEIYLYGAGLQQFKTAIFSQPKQFVGNQALSGLSVVIVQTYMRSYMWLKTIALGMSECFWGAQGGEGSHRSEQLESSREYCIFHLLHRSAACISKMESGRDTHFLWFVVLHFHPVYNRKKMMWY